MEATALSIGKSVLDGALGYAKSALAEEVALQLGVRRDQVFITNELEMMQAFLMTAHDERYDDDRVVKVWVKQVRDVAYDVEDTLQEFAVRLGKQSWWRIRRTLLDRRHVAKQMKELRANVEDVSQRNMRYHLIKGSSSKAATPAELSTIASATMSAVDEARRQQDNAKSDLVRLINKKDKDLRVISVWGKSVCDHGEMFIIKRAYEDPKMHMKFECRAWISELMRPFNSIEFLKSVLGQFYTSFLQEIGKEEKAALAAQVLKIMGLTKKIYLAHEFKKYLNGRSYLIVLNDINSIEEWDQIKTCFPDNKKGSLIIVSTEQIGVASLCIGAENGAPEHKQLLADQTLHVFYKKGSQDGINSTEVGSRSNVNTTGSGSSADRKMVNHTKTVLAAFKESQLIGRETEKSEVIKLITNEDSQQLEVICVWGMGGIGKTTLVKDVYQNQELSGKFEKRACVTIMRPFNRDKLLKDLARQFGKKDGHEMVKHLEGKKYLIVLDDLSSNTEWDTIIPYFPKVETSSRIIVTTRLKSVAEHCSKKHENTYLLRSLGHNDSLDLFSVKVFGKTTNLDEEFPELVEQTNQILKKCDGLPLAIVIIGGFLANQQKTTVEWRKLNEHITAELEMNPELENIRSVLIKSYDGLPYHLKSCFLYMPIFPENQSVRRRRLVYRWTAEGYSREVRGKSAEEIADGYFMELISRSMVLPSQQSYYSRKGIDSCQVHNLIREIGISKSMEENLVFRLEQGCRLKNQGMARHLALNGNWDGDQSEFENRVDMSRVRSLTVFGQWKSFFISDKMSLLRALDLEDTTDLYDHHLKHIGKLIHLRYLSLRGCDGIFHLPDSLGNLRQLETLDIKGTSIVMLPKSVIKLRKLNSLCAGTKPEDEDVSYDPKVVGGAPSGIRNCLSLCVLPFSLMVCCVCGCITPCVPGASMNHCDVCTMLCNFVLPAITMCLDGHGVLLPGGMGKLKDLHTLGVVNIRRHGKVFLKDIKGLTQLRKLGVAGVSKENGQELCSAIVGLSHLESLSIGSDGEPGLSGCLDGMSSPPENLQSLKLYGNLVKLPEWIPDLKNLVKLKLRGSRISEHDATIHVLGNLPNLAALHLLEKSFTEEVNLHFHGDMFQSLLVLEVYLVDNLKSVKFEGRATPKLELLQFCNKPVLIVGMVYSTPSLPSSEEYLLTGLQSLQSLKEFVLIGKYKETFVEDLREQLARNPNKPVLKRK